MPGAAARAGGGGGYKIGGSYLGHRVAACDERRGAVWVAGWRRVMNGGVLSGLQGGGV